MKMDFLLVKEHGERLRIDVRSEDGFPVHFEKRIIETLQFVFGQPVRWAIMRKLTGDALTVAIDSRRVVAAGARALAPIAREAPDPKSGRSTPKFHRSLFYRFLKHTLGYEARGHPLWAIVDAIYEAGLESLDAKALALTVSIESLLQREFSSLGERSKVSKETVGDLGDVIDRWNGSSSVKRRAKGLMSMLRSNSAKNILHELVQRGAITDEQRKAWDKLRNASAHGYQSWSGSGDEFYKLVCEVEVLLYHLIFFVIGYEGPYTDYGSMGWPLRQYPLCHSRNKLGSCGPMPGGN